MELTPDILQQLGAPFPEEEIGFLPRGNWDGKAKALPYIDARAVMNRLDSVVGSGNWSFNFDMLTLDGKMVRGSLTVCGVTKCDAGEGASEDECLKSAVSDSLKRAAVHFGIGRYLYFLDAPWAPFDQRKRQFTETPRIPAAAINKALTICGIVPTNQHPHRNAQERPQAPQQRQQQPRNIHQEAESAMRGQERPAASMVANGGPGAPPATPSMGALGLPALQRQYGETYQRVTGRRIATTEEKAAFREFTATALDIPDGFEWSFGKLTAAQYQQGLTYLAHVERQKREAA